MNTIHNFSASLIQRTKQAGRYSTSGIYTSTVNSFFRFIGHRSITFADLTPSLIKQYEDRLLGEGRRHNTISTYMRMLRSISHQAAEQGIPFTHSIDDLFAYVFTGYEPTAKRAISPLLIRRLVNLDLEKKPALRFSRDMFLLSFYLRGIPFVDLVHLRKTDVKHNTIYYYRLPSNFTYRTMQKVEEAIRLHEKKSERRILLATIAAAIFLIGVSGTGLVLYFGDSIREAFTPTTLPQSESIQIPCFYLLLILTIPLFILFDRWMRKLYFKHHTPKLPEF